jgi:hypothetical protein
MESVDIFLQCVDLLGISIFLLNKQILFLKNNRGNSSIGNVFISYGLRVRDSGSPMNRDVPIPDSSGTVMAMAFRYSQSSPTAKTIQFKNLCDFRMHDSSNRQTPIWYSTTAGYLIHFNNTQGILSELVLLADTGPCRFTEMNHNKNQRNNNDKYVVFFL